MHAKPSLSVGVGDFLPLKAWADVESFFLCRSFIYVVVTKRKILNLVRKTNIDAIKADDAGETSKVL